MRFHTFGQPSSPVILLIHGMLTPWQIWGPQIAHFCRDHYVIAAALDAHTEEEPSEFRSIEEEADTIAAYLRSKKLTTLHAVCGISLGGAVACRLWQNSGLRIRHLVLDGAPIVRIPKAAEFVMTQNYLRIIRKSRLRDPKTIAAFKRDFLPEQYLESYLKMADIMSADSIRNAIASVSRYTVQKDGSPDTRILFIHGTKGNEAVSKKAAQRMKQFFPQTEIVCLEGCAHCEYAIYQPEKWLDIVENRMHRE